jgi:hypothetical protein
MAEIEITLPTVQYGNVKVRATPEEFGFKLDEPGAFGYALAIYQTSFTLGFKDGSQVDVVAPSGPSKSDEVTQAQALLNEGLGGVTEVPAAEAETVTESAPWTEKVDAKPKPWETNVTAPAVLDATW